MTTTINFSGNAIQIPMSSSKPQTLVSADGKIELTVPKEFFPIPADDGVIVTIALMRATIAESEPDNPPLILPPKAKLIVPGRH